MSHTIVDDIRKTVQEAAVKLHRYSESETTVKPAPDKWSKNEILGHLLDSAVNNHHRFVRAQLVETLVFPDYIQNDWVRLQDYNSCPWNDLIELWRLYNLHLAHILDRMPAQKFEMMCTLGAQPPKRLGTIVDQYFAHLRHHVQQLGVL